MSNPRNPTGPNTSPALLARAPKTLVELQVVVDRLYADLLPASDQIIRVPVERTVPNGGDRGVILTLSASSKDIFGQVVEYEVPRVIRSLVHDGQQPFTFAADVASSRAVARLVERARRLRVDVFITRDAAQFAELRERWRV